MKPACAAIIASVLLGSACALFGHPMDIYDYVVVVFATSILVWTFEQYDHRRQH